MNLCSIASGSSGNCVYIGTERTHLLVDAGISGRKIENGLVQIKKNPNELNGILITHEHSDHVAGVGVMARRYNIPIYGTVETITCMLQTKHVGKIPEELFHFIQSDQSFFIQDIQVNPFSISHDASNPVCYSFESAGKKISIATDLGEYTDYTISKLQCSDILLLEANHDVNMLQVGSYPYLLKRRILGKKGHLSNENSGKLICELMCDKLKYIFLGHLSKENNYPELAYETVMCELSQMQKEIKQGVSVKVAYREKPSDFVTI